MSEIIQFPTNNPPSDEEHPAKKSPVEALAYVLRLLDSEETKATQLIVAWSHEENETLSLRYLVSGEEGMTSAVGLLELVKINMITE